MLVFRIQAEKYYDVLWGLEFTNVKKSGGQELNFANFIFLAESTSKKKFSKTLKKIPFFDLTLLKLIWNFKISKFRFFLISPKWLLLEQTLISVTPIILVTFWGVTEVRFSCSMHRSGDTATLVLKPNSGWLSTTPIQKAQISLKIRFYNVILMPATISILLIYFTYEVKKMTLLSKATWNSNKIRFFTT